MTPRNIPRVKQRIRGLDMVARHPPRPGAIMDQFGHQAASPPSFDDFNQPPQMAH